MRLRLTPRDTSFYGFFTDAAANLVEGAQLLCASLEGGADRPGDDGAERVHGSDGR